MKNLHLPASCAFLSPEEQREILGGGEIKDAWNEFVDNLRMDDFFFNGGLISLSFTFIPTLLFGVVVSVYDYAGTVYNKVKSWFGVQDDTLTSLQNYTDEMRQKQQQQQQQQQQAG